MEKYNEKSVAKLIEDISNFSCPDNYGLKNVGHCGSIECSACFEAALKQAPEED